MIVIPHLLRRTAALLASISLLAVPARGVLACEMEATVQASVAATVARFRQMLPGAPEGFPVVMPMTAAVAPAFTAKWPELAIIFDNLHSMHDVISVAGWRRMTEMMGVHNQGGPAVGFVPALPTPSLARGFVMRHDKDGNMLGPTITKTSGTGRWVGESLSAYGYAPYGMQFGSPLPFAT